jgi:outer membrane protein assembly factor BamE (lipoprotein component of BamABCDE complex)
MKRIFLFLSLILAGCQPFIDNRGYNQETLELADIRIDTDTQETIREKLGTPSTTSIFPEKEGRTASKWFYITKRTSTSAFFTPETLMQQTYVISFDAKGIVCDVQKFIGETQVPVNQRKTESTGYESSVLRDIFGNFGRYSNKKPTPQ